MIQNNVQNFINLHFLFNFNGILNYSYTLNLRLSVNKGNIVEELINTTRIKQQSCLEPRILQRSRAVSDFVENLVVSSLQWKLSHKSTIEEGFGLSITSINSSILEPSTSPDTATKNLPPLNNVEAHRNGSSTCCKSDCILVRFGRGIKHILSL